MTWEEAYMRLLDCLFAANDRASGACDCCGVGAELADALDEAERLMAEVIASE